MKNIVISFLLFVMLMACSAVPKEDKIPPLGDLEKKFIIYLEGKELLDSSGRKLKAETRFDLPCISWKTPYDVNW
ncbi:MAG: hypothetical protein ACRCWI_04140 [Brevinema sp.]